MQKTKLQVDVHSFSYKKGGIPRDSTGNGGGYCFDCRGILNPGRIDEYKSLTGRDESVQEFLETKTKMPIFLENVKSVILISIDNYIERGFEHLQINFGCTGGQHRSVYAAEKVYQFLKERYSGIEVCLFHDEQPQWYN
ncbi:MAG: ATP-binding protein [Bergeyella sp.]|nr:ATP-binding protein [Bergeyella sp.]